MSRMYFSGTGQLNYIHILDQERAAAMISALKWTRELQWSLDAVNIPSKRQMSQQALWKENA